MQELKLPKVGRGFTQRASTTGDPVFATTTLPPRLSNRCRGVVSYEMYPGIEELVIDVPVAKRHHPHDIVDRLIRRNPQPNGRDAKMELQVVDDRHPNWFDVRLAYRPIDLPLRRRAQDPLGFTIRLARAPLGYLLRGTRYVMRPDGRDDPSVADLTPQVLGLRCSMSRVVTVRLAGRPVDVQGVWHRGHWHARGAELPTRTTLDKT